MPPVDVELAKAELAQLRGAPDYQDRLRQSLFPQQIDLVFNATARKRVACCSRRAGKTQGLIRGMLLRCLERPGSVVVYFGMTIKAARKVVWDHPGTIPDIIHELGIHNVCKMNMSPDYSVHFANGSVLWIAGCDTKDDVRVWKGFKYSLCIVDESQDWPEETLCLLVDDALTPALMDGNGELALCGVPSPRVEGLFYDASNGIRKGWSIHGWTCFENPHIKNPMSFVNEVMAERGLTLNDPVIQRDYFGRWVRDETTLLYHYQPGRNDFEELPPALAWQHVLGLDFGSRDLTTFVLNSYRQYDRTVYTSEAYGEAMAGQASVTRCVEIVNSFKSRYGSGLQFVGDGGALGLFIIDELRHRYGIPVIAAKKQEKAAAIRLMNDQLRLGLKRYSPATGELKNQLLKLQIDPRTQIEKPSQPCDFADADLYAWRHCYSYLAKPEPDDSADGRRQSMISKVMRGQREAFESRFFDPEQQAPEMEQ